MQDLYEAEWDADLKWMAFIKIAVTDLVDAYGVDYEGPLGNFALRQHASVKPGPPGFVVLSRVE